jgi:hypothetical protein
MICGPERQEKKSERKAIMSRFTVKLTANEIGKLSNADIVFILMVHESKEVIEGYEQHIIQHLLPRIHTVSFSDYESIWGTDTEDFERVTDILDSKGFLHTRYQCTMQRINAGDGLTAVWIIIPKRSSDSFNEI